MSLPGFVTLLAPALQSESGSLIIDLTEYALRCIVRALQKKGNHRVAILQQEFESEDYSRDLFEGLYEQVDMFTNKRLKPDTSSSFDCKVWKELLQRQCIVNYVYLITDCELYDEFRRVYRLTVTSTGDKGKLCHFRALFIDSQLSNDLFIPIFLWDAFRGLHHIPWGFHDCLISSNQLTFYRHPIIAIKPCNVKLECCCLVDEIMMNRLRTGTMQDAYERRRWILESRPFRAQTRQLMRHIVDAYWIHHSSTNQMQKHDNEISILFSCNANPSGLTSNLYHILKKLKREPDACILKCVIASLVLVKLLQIDEVNVDEPVIDLMSIRLDRVGMVYITSSYSLKFVSLQEADVTGIIIKITERLYKFLLSYATRPPKNFGINERLKEVLCSMIVE